MAFYFSTHINIYRPTTSMVVISWLFRKSMTTVFSMAIALILKNLNCRLRNIHILKCRAPNLFWNLNHYNWSHKRLKNWYFPSSEGLCVDLLEVFQPLCSILEATSRNHRPQSENPHLWQLNTGTWNVQNTKFSGQHIFKLVHKTCITLFKKKAFKAY